MKHDDASLSLFDNAGEIICGVDEAGRGPLAGAVYAAAVILDPARPVSGLRDSKKLSEARSPDTGRAVEGLQVAPTLALIDGNRCPVMPIRSEAIVKGDDKVAAISAASILAKTARDASLMHLHQQYPMYGFDRHKGYPTALHLERLRLHGVSPVHRRSYAPVRELLGQEVKA